MGIYLKENSQLARLAAFFLKKKTMALTLGTTIHLWHTKPGIFLQNQKWVRHEIAHVQQFQQNGFIFFILAYSWQTILHGYTKNKFEVSARMQENDTMDLKNYTFICHKQ